MGQYKVEEVKEKLSKVIRELDTIRQQQHQQFEMSKSKKRLDIYSLEKSYSLEEFMECGLEDYINVLKYCLQNDVKGIVDIGCAYGYQFNIFKEFGIDYIGIDMFNAFEVEDKFLKVMVDNSPYKLDEWTYIFGLYPNVELPEKAKDYLAVANMSLTWMELDIETMDGNLRGLQRDFSKVLINANLRNLEQSKIKFNSIEDSFGNFKIIDLGEDCDG